MNEGATRGRTRPSLVLAAGTLAVSSAAILISLARAEGIPVIAIASLRLSVAAAVAAPIALIRAGGELRRLCRGDLLLGLAAGILLALHFAFWTSSLDRTSVMSSVVFVSTNPLFVALASALLLREKVGRWTLAGIVVAVAGGAIIGLADAGKGGGDWFWGDLLALLGAVSASGYLLIGRELRKRLSLPAYIGIAYTTAAVTLLAIAGITRTPFLGHSWKGYLFTALLAAGPQLIGHTAYNWALKYVSATFVTVTLLAEPIGATLLAIPVLSQVPSPMGLGGGMLILMGILVAARGERRAGFLPAHKEKDR
jgi:drug/metabolite transporter (DMT)-like permease